MQRKLPLLLIVGTLLLRGGSAWAGALSLAGATLGPGFSSASVKTMVPTVGVGIILAPNNAINSLDSTMFTGEIIGGFNKTITLMSGVKPIQPPPQNPVPEPSVMILTGIGLVAIGLARKRPRKRA